MTGTLDENDVRACDDCHLHGTALRIREAVAEIKRLKAELTALQAAPLAQLALYAAWMQPPVPPVGEPRRVGCERQDGLLNIHPESETCEVCVTAVVEANRHPAEWDMMIDTPVTERAQWRCRRCGRVSETPDITCGPTERA